MVAIFFFFFFFLHFAEKYSQLMKLRCFPLRWNLTFQYTKIHENVPSSVASPICQEGQSERTAPILPFLPDFFPFSPIFPDFLLFFPLFHNFWQIFRCQWGYSAPLPRTDYVTERAPGRHMHVVYPTVCMVVPPRLALSTLYDGITCIISRA